MKSILIIYLTPIALLICGACHHRECYENQDVITLTPSFDNEHDVDEALQNILLTGYDMSLDSLVFSMRENEGNRLLPYYIILSDIYGSSNAANMLNEEYDIVDSKITRSYE